MPLQLLRCLKNQNGTVILFIIVFSVFGAILMSSFFLNSRYTLKKSGKRKVAVAAFNIAEAGKERVLAGLRNRELNPSANQTATVYSDEPFGSGSYTVWYSTNAGNDTIRIFSIGKCLNDSVKIEILATLIPNAWQKWIKGAVNARTPIQTLGNIIIDGRDHDTNGVVLGTGGTFGVSAGGTVTAGGSSQIGGGFTVPQQPAIEGVTVQSNIDTAGYPQTPEEVLGLPPGSLDSYKTSSCPSTCSGITYIESNCTDYTGSGILICHNSSITASLGNFHGNFKGLIIADEDKHFNGSDTIIGAVIMLGKTTGGNCFGNGDTQILYSSEMLEKAINDALSSGRRSVPVISWRQVW